MNKTLDPSSSLTESARLEREFMDGFVGKLLRLRAVGSPVDEQVYDATFTVQDIVRSDEKGEALRWLRRSGSSLSLADVPHNPTLKAGISRKPLFGVPKLRVAIAAHCWSPFHLWEARPDEEPVPASVVEIDAILEQLRVDERSDVYHYIGIASTTGWDITSLQEAPSGPNFDLVLVAPQAGGWVIHHATEWPEHMVQLFNPESEEGLEQRFGRFLMAMPELQVARGLVLVDEIADALGVTSVKALLLCEDWCTKHKELRIEQVQGDMILRRIAEDR